MTTSRQGHQARKTRAVEDPKGEVESLASDHHPTRQCRFPVIAIGASAGGLEAFIAFLGALQPDPGMAFVFTAHLDPSRESSLTQILARSTAMPVLEAHEGMPLERNHVYVIPPNRDMTVINSRLHVVLHRES